MPAELINVPTNSLIEMLFRILTGKPTVTAGDGTEMEQIQRELQKRGEDQHYGLLRGPLIHFK